MTKPDIKTFLVDGGTLGCGRSIATRAIADMYLHGADNGYLELANRKIPRCRVFVLDACNDPNTETGYQLWQKRGLATVQAGRFGTDAGSKAYETIVEQALAAAVVWGNGKGKWVRFGAFSFSLHPITTSLILPASRQAKSRQPVIPVLYLYYLKHLSFARAYLSFARAT
jgi:hypothetical protein